MNVVSYFDGMSNGQVALNELGIKIDSYNAFEIDKYAIDITQRNYSKTIQNGSVVDADLSLLPRVDLLIGGSPCQSFSVAGHERTLDRKSLTCTATMYKGAGNNGMTLIRRPDQKELSVLNVQEVERLMNVPKNYTDGVSNTQRYKMLGNGWDVAVIKHIFKNL